MRQTSIDAYNQIKAEGLLSKRRFEVYQILAHNGPMTAHEVVSIARDKYPYANQTGFNARLSELQTLGCIKTVGEKINPISGKFNTLWETTDGLPVEPKKKVSKLEKAVEEAIKKERLRCADLVSDYFGLNPHTVEIVLFGQ